jgi:hypothetical protein
MIRSMLGTGGSYATDLIGSTLMTDEQKDNLDITHKTLTDLLWKNPTRSAISQNPNNFT